MGEQGRRSGREGGRVRGGGRDRDEQVRIKHERRNQARLFTRDLDLFVATCSFRAHGACPAPPLP